MKNVIVILIVSIVVGGIFFIGYFMLQNPGSNTQQPNTSTGSPGDVNIPNNTQTGVQTGTQTTGTQPENTLSIATADDGAVLVKNFITNGTAKLDPNNPGHYYLAGLFTVTNQRPRYSIVYNETDQSFNISLWEEPLSATRLQAEQELKRDLNISEPCLCALRYWIGTSNQVNKTLGGTNLGFSFCTGATQLP